MSSGRKLDTSKRIVTPSARRGCSDDHSSESNKDSHIPTILSVIETLEGSEDLKKLSNQVLLYADKTETEMKELSTSIEAKDRAKVEKHAAALTGMCSDMGATQMMRICYQLQIIARQGSLGGAKDLYTDLQQEFETVKSTLRLA